MSEDIVARIVRECGVPDLIERWERLAPADRRSLLLELFAREAARTRPAEVLADRRRSSLYAPAALDVRAMAGIEAAVSRVLDGLPDGFEPIELSPVSPLGTSHTLSRVSQNAVLSALRNAEVMADPTTAMALECALRREAKLEAGDRTAVRLCASQRVARLQPIPKVEGYAPHFRLFAMCTAGRDEGSDGFERASLREHVVFHLRLFAALREEGYFFGDPCVSIADTRLMQAICDAAGVARDEIRANIRNGAYDLFAAHAIDLPRWTREPARDLTPFAARYGIARIVERLERIQRDVLDPLARDFPEARLGVDTTRIAGTGYYDGYMLMIQATTPKGARIPLCDGGFTDWTRKLLSNAKERLFVSAIGTELVAKVYASRSA